MGLQSALTAAQPFAWPRGSLLADTNACLLIGPQWLGDAVMAQPLVGDLARSGPVDVICLTSLATVYAHMPGIRHVLPVDFERGRLQWASRRGVAAACRSRGYARAVVCPNSWKSALIPWMAGIPSRCGLRGEWRYGLLNDIRQPPSDSARGPSQPQQYATLSDDPIRLREALPTLKPCTDLPAGLLALQETQRPLLVLCPGAAYGPAKQWPAAHFATVASDWIHQGGEVLLLGSAADKAIEASIIELVPAALRESVRPLSGQTSLSEAMALLSLADAVVSNDSGLMHVGAALGRPVIGLYGSTDPLHTPARGPAVQLMSERLSCSPCFERTCPIKTTACLQSLSPKRVIDCLSERSTWSRPS